MHGNNEVVKSKILNKFVDVLFKNCHEHSCHGSFEKQFDNLKRKLIFKRPSHGKIMIEVFEGCHAFFDLVADYMDEFFSWGSWLNVCNKGQIFYHNFFPVCFDVSVSLKNEDKVGSWDHLLSWLHWE